MPDTETEEAGTRVQVDVDLDRLEEKTEIHEETIDVMHEDERRARYAGLEGEYRRPEIRFAWDEEDKLARQVAALADWGPKEARKFRSELSDRLEPIQEDEHLKEEGKKERSREAAAELAAEYLGAEAGHADRGGRLVAAEANLDRFEKRIEQRAEELTVTEPPDPDTAAYSAARERELREALAEKEGADRRRFAKELVDSGDPEAIRAVLDPPAGISPLTDRTMEDLQERVLREKYGDEHEQLEVLGQMIDAARRNVAEARREIARAGGLE